MIQRKPASRLGNRGIQEVKDHIWFKSYPWKNLYEKKIEAPFIPKIGDNFDSKYCNTPDQLGLITQEKYERLLKEEADKPSFDNYYFYYNMFDSKDSNNTMSHKFTNPHAIIISPNITFSKPKKIDILPKIQASPTIGLNPKLTKSKNLTNCGSASSIYDKDKNNRYSVLTSTINGPTIPVSKSYRFRKSGSVINQSHKCS